jgi:hypothetical protein
MIIFEIMEKDERSMTRNDTVASFSCKSGPCLSAAEAVLLVGASKTAAVRDLLNISVVFAMACLETQMRDHNTPVRWSTRLPMLEELMPTKIPQQKIFGIH